MTHSKTSHFCECITCKARRLYFYVHPSTPCQETTMHTDKMFFILWQPDSPLPPRIRFSTYAEAVTVAESMAITHKKKFYVMQAMAWSSPVVPPPPPREVETVTLR